MPIWRKISNPIYKYACCFALCHFNFCDAIFACILNILGKCVYDDDEKLCMCVWAQKENNNHFSIWLVVVCARSFHLPFFSFMRFIPFRNDSRIRHVLNLYAPVFCFLVSYYYLFMSQACKFITMRNCAAALLMQLFFLFFLPSCCSQGSQDMCISGNMKRQDTKRQSS